MLKDMSVNKVCLAVGYSCFARHRKPCLARAGRTGLASRLRGAAPAGLVRHA